MPAGKVSRRKKRGQASRSVDAADKVLEPNGVRKANKYPHPPRLVPQVRSRRHQEQERVRCETSGRSCRRRRRRIEGGEIASVSFGVGGISKRYTVQRRTQRRGVSRQRRPGQQPGRTGEGGTECDHGDFMAGKASRGAAASGGARGLDEGGSQTPGGKSSEKGGWSGYPLSKRTSR